VRVEFVERLRGQMTFDSLDGLLEQMATDVDRSRSLLSGA
ncbi:MAG: riboflavin kinase, partial [Candidatus Nanopelagicales bacterium]|nr:riboflavin kinase [Candidatus Nanopelagicales bacterium]